MTLIKYCLHLLCGLLCVLSLAAANAGNVAAVTSIASARPLLPLLTADTLAEQCSQTLQALEEQRTHIARLPLDGLSADALLAAWNRLQISAEDFIGPVYLLNNVAPDAALRRAADDCLVRYNRYSTALFQDVELYRRIQAIAPIATIAPADSVQRKLRQDLIDAFEDTGVALAEPQRLRLQAILERLENLRQEYSRNLRDNATQLRFTAAEMQGLPQSYLEQQKRDAQGHYLLGFAYPQYIPFMENARDGAARQRYQLAYTNRGGARNLALLDEVVSLRQELAQLLGQPSYAAFALRRRMAKTPAVVSQLLDQIQAEIRARETRELEELRRLKAEDLGLALQDSRLERWDVAYYQERLKQGRYRIDQEALRRYFPSEAALAWAMDICAELYGLRFEQQQVPVWHEDVRYYDVIDAGSGNFLGGIYIDPYPRTGKYGHAAAFAVRGVSLEAGRTPISVLVSNFNRQGLDHQELETLVHEFGHVMHGVLSQTRYLDHAGTHVERDFVEAPSQMFEEWARRLETLQRFARHCPDCPGVDAALLERLEAARQFGRGIRYARQHLYASYDMTLYGQVPASGQPKAQALWQQMEAATPLGHVAGTSFAGQFEHIVRGYAAGYYGYLWSEVLALDMLSHFGEQLMNPLMGQHFRQQILARGGEQDGNVLVENFLGRPPSTAAFFAKLRGQTATAASTAQPSP